MCCYEVVISFFVFLLDILFCEESLLLYYCNDDMAFMMGHGFESPK